MRSLRTDGNNHEQELNELTNLIMDNYDVYNLSSIENRDVRETVEFMMSNWKNINQSYKVWRVSMTLRTLKNLLNQ